MLCAISGEAPQHPVASSKSGNVFEKSLIEAYISEHGKDPVTGDDLTTDELVELKTARIVRPRPPTLTSIPSLLSVFQNEWDALALESYALRQQLAQTRQELSTALYQHDAAVRVIARLTKERDEARDALSKVSINGAAANGDQMQIDQQGLPEDLAEKVDATQEKLSKSRRKRPVPNGWVTPDVISSFEVLSSSGALYPGGTCLSVDASGAQALVGGSNGVAGVLSIAENQMVHTLKVGGGAVTDGVWFGSRPVVSTMGGHVKVFDGEEETASFTSHAGAAHALALHPSGEILASVGIDKSFVFYDLMQMKPVTQVYTDSALTAAAFHPDGHFFAAGGVDGQIKFFTTKTGESAANFDLGAPVASISFSENGYFFAAAGQDSSSVTIFDLRKEGKAAEVKVIEAGSAVSCVRWDYTGQFLATASASGITVQQYLKSSKSWSEPLRTAVQATAVAWGDHGQQLVSVNASGVVSTLAAK